MKAIQGTVLENNHELFCATIKTIIRMVMMRKMLTPTIIAFRTQALSLGSHSKQVKINLQ